MVVSILTAAASCCEQNAMPNKYDCCSFRKSVLHFCGNTLKFSWAFSVVWWTSFIVYSLKCNYLCLTGIYVRSLKYSVQLCTVIFCSLSEGDRWMKRPLGAMCQTDIYERPECVICGSCASVALKGDNPWKKNTFFMSGRIVCPTTKLFPVGHLFFSETRDKSLHALGYWFSSNERGCLHGTSQCEDVSYFCIDFKLL